MGRVSRVVAVLAAVGMLFSGGVLASAAESTGPAPGGASQCVPDRSTIAQCFPDKALAQGIADKLKGDKDRTGVVLTSKDVKDTTSLYSSDYSGFSSVSSLQGLQVFTNLERLDLSGTRVSDVSPLSKLTKLTELDLGGTQVSDVSPLSKLVNLEYLNFAGNRVSDVSPLSKLVHLKELYLYGTGVSDVSPLSKLTNLEDLGLDSTGVSDVSPLSKLVNLTSLWLNSTKVSDVSPLSNLVNLTSLNLGGTGVSDVSPLSKLTNLEKLNLGFTKVSDVSPLSNLTNLRELGLSDTRVLDLSPLSKLHRASLSSLWAGDVRPSVNLTVNADGSVSLPAPRWTDGSFVAPSSTSPAGGVLDAKRGVVTWKKYDAKASYSYDFNRGGMFTGHVAGVKPQARMVFRDVSSSTPHASDIAWLADTGVSQGWREPDGSYSFRGMDSVKRQDMAAFLRREAKRLGVKDAASWKPSDKDWKQFRDVSRDTPHAEDVLWLAHANVSTGWPEPDGSRTFRGMDPVRRQDMAAFLYRLAVKAGRGGGVRPGSFRDVSDATPHASEVRWLGGSGVSTGYADGTFRGMLPVYRQDMAAFLHRFDNLKK
ncbi:leucine-rich repeat domain-containing protein [Bifidobacterium boum]|uniref:leucine-rich repeat domain-containing protein n=1 Tax=Bifidobacterium boum TaxID=78343 RepID=UPI001F3E022D|nr:leucine-rich repeat domain-containing protein [Bifidobacterium boum]MCF2562381.1 leucine-rich repeat domain-containing protein [Bifidobacterium boum]